MEPLGIASVAKHEGFESQASPVAVAMEQKRGMRECRQGEERGSRGRRGPVKMSAEELRTERREWESGRVRAFPIPCKPMKRWASTERCDVVAGPKTKVAMRWFAIN